MKAAILRALSLAAVAVCCAAGRATAQNAAAQIVQISGVALTADSLRGVYPLEVVVKGKNRGVDASPAGVFSIVVMKGDTLEFNAPGYRTRQYAVPYSLEGTYFSLVQLMVQDTFYLAETIVRPLPSGAAFDYAFRTWRIPDDKLEIARKNTDRYVMSALARTLPRTGSENAAQYQRYQQAASVYYGQQAPMRIFSPQAWGEFIEAWKRGDFRKK